MALFYIQDSDRPGYVIAENYQQAVKKWQNAVSKENDNTEIDPPIGVEHLANDEDIILENDWLIPYVPPKCIPKYKGIS